jgi:hypothetical protein
MLRRVAATRRVAAQSAGASSLLKSWNAPAAARLYSYVQISPSLVRNLSSYAQVPRYAAMQAAIRAHALCLLSFVQGQER